MSVLLMEKPKEKTAPPLDEEALTEIIDGVIVEKEPMSTKAAMIAGELSRLLGNYAKPSLGHVCPELLIRLPGSTRYRRPDVVYVSYSEWPKDREVGDENGWPVRPDLCIEVASPTDGLDKAMVKVEEYLRAGVKAIWLVYPHTAIVQVFDSMDSTRLYRRDQTLPGGDILPGFTLKLSDVLPKPSAIEPPDDA